VNIGPTVMIDLNGYAHTTSGKTVFEAARNALDFFLPSYVDECRKKAHAWVKQYELSMDRT
jgi:hypothetical protein